MDIDVAAALFGSIRPGCLEFAKHSRDSGVDTGIGRGRRHLVGSGILACPDSRNCALR
jgi:hypothetical protein